MMPLKQEGGVAMMMHTGMVPIKQEGMGGTAAGGGIGGYPNGIGFPNGLINQAAGVPGLDPAAALQINGIVGAGGIGGNGLAVAGEPAGVSTAESGPRQLTPDPMGFMSQAFMSNGAPVLVRGGGNPASGSAPNAGMLAYPLMPQQHGVKIEGGGGGGMVPVGAMAPAQLMHHSGSTANMGAANPPPLQALPDGIIRDQSLDDFGSYVDFQVVGGGGGGGSDHETRKQQILKQQRWLLFLRHCAKCNLAETQCQYGHNCTVAKNLWQHLIACKDPSCTYARCVPSRELLKHHQNCTSERCPVCAPVKQYVLSSGKQSCSRNWRACRQKIECGSKSTSDDEMSRWLHALPPTK